MILLSNNQKFDRDMMRQTNSSLVLRMLKEKEVLSKTELSKITKLTVPSITSILSELESYDLINTLGQTPIKRGRFPVMYQLNFNAFYIIGITIHSESIKIVIINLNGQVKNSLTKPFGNNIDSDHVLEEVRLLVEDIIKKSKIKKNKIIGVGVGMHGIVDPFNGIAIYPPHLGWRDVPISEILEKKLNLPVLVDSDCNVLALAERWFGKGVDQNSFIVMNVDYGIGTGIMISGNLFHGADYGGGQIGHITVIGDGLKCSCGNYGCLETVASESAILNGVRKKINQGFDSILLELTNNHPDSITLEHIFRAATIGDDLSKQALKEAGHYLGIGISTLVNLFNPQQIILTGEVSIGNEFIIQPLEDAVNQKSLYTNTRNLEITTSNLGSFSGAIGASTLWIDALFNGKLKMDELLQKRDMKN
ncbi:ROK family protein [Viridibacillus arvi]|uniref:ROK family protein n=1 Tax=Viridibacillus arvi TaxID=263475 RepID=UPI0034CDA30B